MDDYFWSFSKSIKDKEDNVTHFIKFVLEGFINSTKEIKEKIIFYIRKFTLRDYYLFLKKKKLITQRQLDLLMLLLDNNIIFSLKELSSKPPFDILYRNVSERTTRRDLQKLSESLLVVDENKRYTLNWRVLE